MSDVDLSIQAASEIKAVLGRRDLSKAELARRLGVSHTWVTNRLTGNQEIGLNDLQRIADVLDVEVADLIPQREGKVVAVGGNGGNARRESKPWNFRTSERPRPSGPPSRTAITASTARTGRVHAAQAA